MRIAIICSAIICSIAIICTAIIDTTNCNCDLVDYGGEGDLPGLRLDAADPEKKRVTPRWRGRGRGGEMRF